MKFKQYVEPMNPIGTVAELFAGVGGFRLGLSAAGWQTIFSNQWEPSTKSQHASEVYVSRFGPVGHTNVDISEVASIPKVDLLVGGFPCQDYSVAKSRNASKGLEGKKGVLWWEILRLVQLRRPKYIFLENVDRLLKSPSSQRGRDFAIMLRTLGDEGYQIEWRVVNAADYGFPQRRIRVFIVGIKTRSSVRDPQKHIFSEGILARALPVSEEILDSSNFQLDELATEISRNFNKGASKSPFFNSGLYVKGQIFTYKTKSNYVGTVRVLGDVMQNDSEVPSEFFVDSSKLPDWKYLKGAKAVERTHKGSGTSYLYAEGKMAFPDSLEKPSRTILTGEGGTSPSRFKHIVQTKKGLRRLTPIELERLNGFPDDWTANGNDGTKLSDARRAFFMGNALVVGLVTRVGEEIAKDMSTKVKSH